MARGQPRARPAAPEEQQCSLQCRRGRDRGEGFVKTDFFKGRKRGGAGSALARGMRGRKRVGAASERGAGTQQTAHDEERRGHRRRGQVRANQALEFPKRGGGGAQ